MADITPDMARGFFNIAKPLSRFQDKVTAEIQGLEFSESDAYKPEFKLQKKGSATSPPVSPMSDYYSPTSPFQQDHFFDIDELNQLELDSRAPQDAPAEPIREEEAAHIYDNYSFDHTYPVDLPITKFQEQIIQTIDSNSVTVVQGETGSGKTTQVPQYILDHYVKQRRYCNILVTQPRRIAAISIAKRVSQERGWHLGGLVGYQVALSKTLSEDTRLAYVTTGVLLRKLIQTKNLNQYTHIILDEVHERDQNSDFCLLVVRKLLRSNSRHVKVILMSATMESDLFSRYFAVPVRGQLEGAPVVTVDSRSYPVEELYLEDLRGLGELPDITMEEPGISKETYILVANLIAYFDQMEISKQGKTEGGSAHERGTVLVFLPGLPEITEVDKVLMEREADLRLKILPLHSQLVSDKQDEIFKKPEEGMRKVILATNIAESSITIPDVKYVIDFCLVKCLVSDADTNFQSLRIQWAAKANCTQRKGRAGRVSAGQCFRLVTRGFYAHCLPEYGIPELQRCPLEQVVLQVKLLDLGEPKTILGLALQPPDPEDIERTVLMLKQVGALTTKMRGGIVNPHDGDLTFVGRVLGSLPVDVHVGKLIVLGYVFGCLEECIVIAAFMSLRAIFRRPFKEEIQAYRSKMAWAGNSFSDCIAALNVYTEWCMLKRTGGFRRGSEERWSAQGMINQRRIREVADLAKELTDRLKNFNLHTSVPLDRLKSKTPQELLIIKLVIAGAFYPNYFVSGDIDEEDCNKVMSGHDPFTTVMVRNVPPYGTQYRKILARKLRPCGRAKALYFEESRAYIEFEPPENNPRDYAGTVVPAVYLAVKMRHLRIPLELEFSKDRNEQIRERLRTERPFDGVNRLRTNRTAASFSQEPTYGPEVQPRQVDIPLNGYLEVYITEFVDAAHFWAQMGDRDVAARLQSLQDSIDTNSRRLEEFRTEPESGTLCLALFDVDGLFYRARISRLIGNHGQGDRTTHVQVLFLDYGNEAVVHVTHLRKLSEEFLRLPFQAFECFLCEVCPVYTSQGLSSTSWSQEATEFLTRIAAGKKLVARVYSLLRGALRVDLYDTTTEEDVHINKLLISKRFGQFREESSASKMAHKQAENLRPNNRVEDNVDWHEEQEFVADRSKFWDIRTMTLRGPFSPYEMSFQNITSIGRLRATRIEMNSVNSVVINDSPQDHHERFLVAAGIAINTSGTTMLAKDTTLMPNIHGLLPLMALIFSPCAEIRTDAEKRQYTGALVGLGYDPRTNMPLLPDHDMELMFDVDINQDDLVLINTIRTAMNMALGGDEAMAEWGTGGVRRIQSASRKKILGLVLKRRENIKPRSFSRAFRWNQIEPEYILDAKTCAEEREEEARALLYTLHSGVLVSGPPLDETADPRVLRLRSNVERLQDMAGRSSEPFPEEIICELCNVSCRHSRGVTLHLESKCHRQESRLLFQD